MSDVGVASLGAELDNFVAAFETAQARDGPVDLAAFLPGPAHPLYREVLRELVRVDLEYGWSRGRARSLEEYRRTFPQLFQDPEDLRAITFEEYRLRRQAGEDPTPDEYRRRFGVDVEDWPAPRDLPDGAETGPAPADFPEEGADFLGFHLIAELGRGAFARVYLARQGELADRPVSLKVSRDALGESHTLAQLQHTNIVPIFSVHRAGPFHAVCMPFLGSTTLADLLRHLQGQKSLPGSGRALVDTLNACQSVTWRGEKTPQAGPGQAAAPRESRPVGYLKTLQGLTYVQAVLWIAARLADGLAHAHERGILHRDLKPANVLLTDEGQPMLLDFNLSEDTKRRADAPAALVGGTLPYMAPEHLAAFRGDPRRTDARADLYALGVILYELLAGRPPYPVHRGPFEAVLARMTQDRRRPPPPLRQCNPAVSPAVETIVRRCLAAEPGRRYQAARELHEDLERHLKDLPLRHAREPSVRERFGKWARRHPRLASSTSVAVLAVVLMLGLGGAFAWRGERLARLEAAESFRHFREELSQAQVAFLDAATGQADARELEASCRRPLDRYQVLDDPSWQRAAALRRLPPEDQERVRAGAGELLFLLAAFPPAPADDSAGDDRRRRSLELNSRAIACYPEGVAPAALLRQRAALERQAGREAEAARLTSQAEATPPRTPRDHCLLACAYAAEGRSREALPLWRRAALDDPQNVWAWYGLGHCYDNLGRPAQAAGCYSACIALNPTFQVWYFRRGLAHLKQGQYRPARDDFDQAIRLRPGHAEAHVNRALARLGDGQGAEAVEDLTRALELGAPPARVYLIRARAREKAGDPAGAARDRAEGLRREPADEAGWVARGAARAASAPRDALADFDRALALNPHSLPALESKAHVLSERLGHTDEALRVLDDAVILDPEYGPARAARAVLLARLGRRDDALRGAREALAVDDSPATLYQVAGAYALTSRQNPDDRRQALELLTSALRQGFGYDLIATDRDLTPLQDDPQFRRLLEAARALHSSSTPPPAGGPRPGPKDTELGP
jgi:serine/threonine protein kinase/Tfp pilus assembly protein PilF